jgi:DNA-binding NarL/FixJ family response regulator
MPAHEPRDRRSDHAADRGRPPRGQGRGFEVLGEAGDGAEAIRLAQALTPDVILMDLRMPGMDGLTAITELARRGITARVLVLTTYDTVHLLNICTKLGVSDRAAAVAEAFNRGLLTPGTTEP